MALPTIFKFVAISLIFHCIKLSFFHVQFIYFFLLNFSTLEPFVKENFRELNFFWRQPVIVGETLIELPLLKVVIYEIEFS